MLQSSLTSSTAQNMTLGKALGSILVESGIADLFCIPGDFVMQLSRELSQTSDLNLRTMSHEYGTTLTALGYALGKQGPSAVCFTYGVGILNATNAIAQAYVERIPLVVISGFPGKQERESGVFLHHEVVDQDSQWRVMREVTTHQVSILEVQDALEKIREAIEIACMHSKPVYIEIARDLYLETVSYRPVPLQRPVPVASVLAQKAAQAALSALHNAQNPVFIPGLELKRYQLAEPVQTILDRLLLPWVASPISRDVLSPKDPKYRGLFAGPASAHPETQTLIEMCDLLWLIGEPNSDINMGIAGKVPPQGLIHAHDGCVTVAGQDFTVSTPDFIAALAQEVACLDDASCRNFLENAPVLGQIAPDPITAAPLTPEGVIAVINARCAQEPERVLVVDCGDSFFMSLGMTPKDVVTSSLYMSMGIGTPGAIGYQLACGQRPIVLVGDGAFQMTGLELMHAQTFGVSPIVILLNNEKWISLSGMDDDMPLIAQKTLDFSGFSQFIGVSSFTVTTALALQEQLAQACTLDVPVLIDARVEGVPRSGFCERYFAALKAGYHLQKVG